MHLTNVYVQKKSLDYDATEGKWELNPLKLYLMSIYGSQRIDNVFYDMEQIIVKSLESVAPIMIQDKHW